MTPEDSNMAANAICFAADMVKTEWINAAVDHSRPSTIFRPRIYPDGDQWCALYGEDLQNGVAGFGNTPALAVQNFDHNWYNQRCPVARYVEQPVVEAGL